MRTLILLPLLVACTGSFDDPDFDGGPGIDASRSDAIGPDVAPDTGADIVDGSTSDAGGDAGPRDAGSDANMDAGRSVPTSSFCACSNENPADNAGSFSMCTMLLEDGAGTYYEVGRSERSPESTPAGAPEGVVSARTFAGSEIYPDVSWNYWVYVPAQYDGSEEAALFVLTDGDVYLRESGSYNSAVVFDNLIDEGAMPLTIAVFVDPGVRGDGGRNRSVEYDRPDDDYVRFLLDELLPVALEGLNVTSDPNRRAIGGRSSGGVAAFKSGWFRPDSFRLLYTALGSFVQLNQNAAGQYAEVFPEWIMAEDRKPLRVTLLSGENDENSRYGSWPAAHMAMTTALDCQGYTYLSGFGDTSHGDGQHVRARYGEDLRWLWAEALP